MDCCDTTWQGLYLCRDKPLVVMIPPVCHNNIVYVMINNAVTCLYRHRSCFHNIDIVCRNIVVSYYDICMAGWAYHDIDMGCRDSTQLCHDKCDRHGILQHRDLLLQHIHVWYGLSRQNMDCRDRTWKGPYYVAISRICRDSPCICCSSIIHVAINHVLTVSMSQ